MGAIHLFGKNPRKLWAPVLQKNRARMKRVDFPSERGEFGIKELSVGSSPPSEGLFASPYSFQLGNSLFLSKVTNLS